MKTETDKLCINTIRTLSMDAVQQANSGHPGTPMALAPLTYTLYSRHLNFNPRNPLWMNRDRFVLSCGHASMLLYSILHLSGYDITLDDIKNFRQIESICAGHPEYGLAPGVETTTGPLGQGAGASVGMAIAQKYLSARYNKKECELFNYRVFALLSDGDMMEGISSEAASFAGHLGLDNLIWLYDENHISIEGNTKITFSENAGERFMSYNWSVLRIADANNVDEISEVIQHAISNKGKPTLVILESHIAYGAPTKQDTASAHGSPLGEEEIKGAKRFYGWDEDKKFYVPYEVSEYTDYAISKGKVCEEKWNNKFEIYKTKYPELAEEVMMILNGKLPDENKINFPAFSDYTKKISGRKANNIVLNEVAKVVPWMIGGSADLAPSTLTHIEGETDFEKNQYSGRNMHYGIRENAMAAISNGISVSGLKAIAGTFFIFTDYAKPSIRISAIMKQPIIYVMTHDSIGLGEDGTTHQPVEQLAAFRAMPDIEVIRPADANEVSVMWKYIYNIKDKPVMMVLSRQDMPVIDRSKYASAEGALKGGYIVADSNGNPDVILISTGSEVSLCIEAYEKLKAEGINPRVVSLPCWSLFESQPKEYRESILPSSVKKRIAVEAASSFGWSKFVDSDFGKFITLETFGASGKYQDLYKFYGITVENIINSAKDLMEK